MAINNYFENTDINIYFHMKNHYKKLRSARSTIDNTFPQSFKTFSTPPGTGRSLNRTNFQERDIKNDPHLPNHSSIVRKHSCVTSASGSSDTSINMIKLIRPKSRRQPCVTNLKMKHMPRSQSIDLTRRKSMFIGSNKTKKKEKNLSKKSNIEDYKSEEFTLNKMDSVFDYHSKNDELDKNHINQSITTETEEKCNKQSRVEEHEYLQFLLRITEDIIMNNLYSNEDIEKVFQTHIEANKDNLKMEKMEAQLARLCVELEVPYKRDVNTENLKCYDQFYDSYISNNNQQLEDCECATKRTLDIQTDKHKKQSKNGNKEQDTEFFLQQICTVLANKCSGDQVTEYTELDNPLEALFTPTKQLSGTSVRSSGNIQILSCFEGREFGADCSKETFQNDTLLDAKDNETELNLTEKEKLGCIEEDIIFEKWNNNSGSQVESADLNEPGTPNNQNDISVDEINKKSEVDVPVKNIAESNSVPRMIDPTKDKTDSDLTILDNDVNILAENLSTVSIENAEKNIRECTSCHNLENIEQNGDILSILLKCEENQINYSTNDISPLKNVIHNDMKAEDELITVAANINKVTTTADEYTQIEITNSDKECNTSLVLNDYQKNDYVLINGPIYVLKTVLNSEDKLIIYDKTYVEKHVGNEIESEKLSNGKNEPIEQYDTIPVLQTQPKLDYVPSYLQKNFSKLLSSDYDLMPQRDGSVSDKYHHLLVDAATSISNINLNGTANNRFTDPEALLLSDKYEMTSQMQNAENLVPKTDTLTKYGVLKENDFHFENGLCACNQYELKSSSMLQEVKSSEEFSGNINKTGMSCFEQTPELDVSLRSRESSSPSIIKEADTKDLSESGEVVRASICTDEELSQISTPISDMERNSSSLSPNRNNILGKRKLKHPS